MGILCSPEFLYRESRSGLLDDYDLASRLSYFLWSAPPDQRLYDLASQEKLSDRDVLASEVRRMLRSQRSHQLVQHFTGQWLDTRRIDEIMPDPRLVRFTREVRDGMKGETELFFREVLDENLDVATFIDSDFTYMNAALARNIYGRNDVESQGMIRVSTASDPMRGGILGQAAVLMATANGVDTSPVTRGVWILENILGDPVPEAPDDVPAIAPDVSGASTIRQTLAAHRANRKCATCHRKIDPLGYALESYDAVGKFRRHYPVYSINEKGRTIVRDGLAVETGGKLWDEREFSDIAELKKLMLNDVDSFSRCLTEKLLVYATGRPMSLGDQRILDQIVADVKKRGNGLQDLLIAVVQSEVFGTK